MAVTNRYQPGDLILHYGGLPHQAIYLIIDSNSEVYLLQRSQDHHTPGKHDVDVVERVTTLLTDVFRESFSSEKIL